jgi:hypothetical protein
LNSVFHYRSLPSKISRADVRVRRIKRPLSFRNADFRGSLLAALPEPDSFARLLRVFGTKLVRFSPNGKRFIHFIDNEAVIDAVDILADPIQIGMTLFGWAA